MPHRTPSFWYPKSQEDEKPLSVSLLRPLSWLYACGFKIHQSMSKTRKADITILCVGNLSAGGTGKTPTCISLMTLLRDSGIAKTPHFLMRGYGGGERGPLLVDPEKHSAWDVGDESLILAQRAPTIISADRIAGAKLAQQNGADIVIMDDGLQNPGIHKDFKLIVINGEMGFGNGLVMPAGPLREPLKAGLKKADAFLIIGDDRTNVKSSLPSETPVFTAHLEAGKDGLPPKGEKLLAFAGLGYPQKFFGFLSQELGYDVVETVAFADHCPYERSDVLDLRAKAKDHGATLITTEKDFMRLPIGYKEDIMTLPVSMQFDEAKALQSFFKDEIQSKSSQAT